jgi:hypothetical protein
MSANWLRPPILRIRRLSRCWEPRVPTGGENASRRNSAGPNWLQRSRLTGTDIQRPGGSGHYCAVHLARPSLPDEEWPRLSNGRTSRRRFQSTMPRPPPRSRAVPTLTLQTRETRAHYPDRKRTRLVRLPSSSRSDMLTISWFSSRAKLVEPAGLRLPVLVLQRP